MNKAGSRFQRQSTSPRQIDQVTVGTGCGVATAHHGEILQGQIVDSIGRARQCLVSLPCTRLYSRVTFHPDGTNVLKVEPPGKHKTRAVMELALEYFGTPGVGGVAGVESNIEEGKGYGSSTADCVAAVKAIANGLGRELAQENIARLVVLAETASDNTMFDDAVLFAQREGAVLEYYGRPIPHMEVLGIDTDKDSSIDTLLRPPPVYSAEEIRLFDELMEPLRHAIRTGDVVLLGKVATSSALVNQRHLPKDLFDEVQATVRSIGGLGIAAAHSGTLLSVLLDPADPKLEHKVELFQREIESNGVCEVFRFETGRARSNHAGQSERKRYSV